MRALVLLVVLAGPLLAHEPVLPDPRTGQVNGLTAVLMWPAYPQADPQAGARALPTAEGCEVRMVPLADRDGELQYPCGKWFVPPNGRYKVWIEREYEISPAPLVMNWTAAPFQGAGLAVKPLLRPAGRITFPADRTLGKGESLRLVAVQTDDVWSHGHRIFDRRVAAANLRQPVQMPAGGVLVGRFDAKTGDAIALAKPVTVGGGKSITVWPVEPQASDVLAVLEKPSGQNPSRSWPKLELHDGTRVRAPETLIDAAERIIAVWYGVDARVATVSMKDDRYVLAPREVRLTRGKVATLRTTLQPRPKVSVIIDAPDPAALPAEMQLEIAAAGKTEHRATVGAGTHVVDAMPAELLHVTLEVDGWTFVETADLTSGENGEVTFHLNPLQIEGTVFHGDEPAPATVAFRDPAGEWIRRETDERGHYATRIWYSGNYTAEVTLRSGKTGAFLDGFRWIEESGTVDFHLPRSDYRVTVRDRTTGEGIAAAEVRLSNVWQGSNLAQTVRTDASGTAILPPLRAGEMTVGAIADGYEPSRLIEEPVSKTARTIELELTPLRNAAELQILLSGGTPAAQAEVRAFDAAFAPIWSGTADANGNVVLPDLASGALVIARHNAAAAAVRQEPLTDRVWRLSPPAAPLTVIVESNAGARVRNAQLVLWIDGIKLSGAALSFAAWAGPAADADGVWIARNLPPKPVQLLAFSLRGIPAMRTAAFDAVARRIEHPWPAAIAAQAAQ